MLNIANTSSKVNNELYCIGNLSLENKYSSKDTQVSICLVKSSLENLIYNTPSFLHKSEYLHFLQYEHAPRKHSFLLGRFAAKKALAQHFNNGIEEKEYNIENGIFGEPILENKRAHIAISHTKTYGVALVSDLYTPVGIDIEFIQSPLCESNFYTQREVSIFKTQARWENEKDIYYFIWSAKEALVKYLKIGFTISLDILEIKSVSYNDGVFFILFNNFHALTVLMTKIKGLILSICLPNSLNPLLTDIKTFSNLCVVLSEK